MRKVRYLVFFMLLVISIIPINKVFALDIATPQIIEAEYVNESTVKLYYETNNSNSNYSIQFYNMTKGKFEYDSIGSTSHSFTDLELGKTYNIVMRAIYNANVSNWSNIVSVTPRQGIPRIDSISTTDTTLTLNYTTNSNPKEIEIYNANTKNSIKTTNLKAYTFNGLAPETAYKFMIRNCYENGTCGNWSQEKEGTTIAKITETPTPTSAPTLDKKKPTINSLIAKKGSVKLNYTVGKSTKEVQIYNSITKTTKTTTSKTAYTWVNLKDYKIYSFKIRSKYTDNTYSSWTSYKKGFTKTSIGKMAIHLAWKKGTSKSIYQYTYSDRKKDGEKKNPKWKKFTSWGQLGTSRPTKNFQNYMDVVIPNHFQDGSCGSDSVGYFCRVGATCSEFARTVIRASGVDPDYPRVLKKQLEYVQTHKDKWKEIDNPKLKESKLKSGDIIIYQHPSGVSFGHILIYVNQNGKGYAVQASYRNNFGFIKDYKVSDYTGKKNNVKFKVFRAI